MITTEHFSLSKKKGGIVREISTLIVIIESIKLIAFLLRL
jgi:hypothetical protein